MALTYRQLKEVLDKMSEQFLDADVLIFSEKTAEYSSLKFLNSKDILEKPKNLKINKESFLFAFHQLPLLRIVN